MEHKYYIHPMTKEIYAFSTDTSEEDIRRYQPDLFDHMGNLTEIAESELDDFQDPTGESRLAGLLSQLKYEINSGFETVISCNKCMKELKYQGGEDGTYMDPHHHGSYDRFDPNGTGYGYQEEQTFEQQYAEAIAYKKSGYKDKSLCPNLITLSSNRGRDLKTTVDKIIEKRETKDRRRFKALGLKQKYMDIVEAAGNDREKLQHLYDTRATWILY